MVDPETRAQSAFGDLEALHLVRVRGRVPRDQVPDLDRLVEAGFVVPTKVGVLVTPAGVEEADRLLAEWRASADVDALSRGYSRFLAVNDRAKSACAAWQQAVGDAESAYLAVDTLREVVDQARPGLRRAAGVIPRFEDYGARLADALEQASTGDTRFLTDPMPDSFHSVWFECHEDFLLTLGISREDEGSY